MSRRNSDYIEKQLKTFGSSIFIKKDEPKVNYEDRVYTCRLILVNI